MTIASVTAVEQRLPTTTATSAARLSGTTIFVVLAIFVYTTLFVRVDCDPRVYDFQKTGELRC